MGYAKDLGYSYTHDICPVTGYPRNQYGFLLNPCSLYDGTPVKDWDKPGTELHNLTSPYGHLYFACGTGDDFFCWDYAQIECVTGRYVILDATINSEPGGFIEGGGYEILPARSSAECYEVVQAAEGMVSDALEWCCFNDVRHSVRGWNQKPEYFLNCVAAKMFPYYFKDTWSERMYRMNTKPIRDAVHKTLTEK